MNEQQGGYFITFEGGEGTGKSTQITRLAAWLEERGHKVLQTREPGGTAGAEAIRELVLAGDVQRWQPMTELLLMMAARSDHLERKIRPALACGTTVVSDRFHDSSRVYQGLAGLIGLDRVDLMHAPLLDDTLPDLTLVLDAPAECGMARRENAGGATRFEAKAMEFHNAVREGFLTLAAMEPERICLIDATASIDQVQREIREICQKRLVA